MDYELITAVKKLLYAIDDNTWDLWENSLEYKPECVILEPGDYEVNQDEKDNWIKEFKPGIKSEVQTLKKLVKKIESEV